MSISIRVALLVAVSTGIAFAVVAACISSDFVNEQFACVPPSGACPPGQTCQSNERCATTPLDEMTSDGGTDADQPESGIRCGDGGTLCTPESQACCLSASPTSLSCVPLTGGVGLTGNGACEGGVEILCDDSADCMTGDLCCINLDTSHERALLGTECRTHTCPSSGDGGSWLKLCALDAETCKGGLSCKPLESFAPGGPFTANWFYACQ